ncbi:MAG: tetratricopeptide repeat protein, partial [bacterium]|nr:tetratricopeptide repeat protein [bacterium]
RTETAEAHLRRAAELEPRRGRAHFQLGLVLARVGRSDEAIDAYRKALLLEPVSPAAHYNVGALLEGMGRVDEAAAEFRKALEIDSSYTRAREALSQIEEGTNGN